MTRDNQLVMKYMQGGKTRCREQREYAREMNKCTSKILKSDTIQLVFAHKKHLFYPHVNKANPAIITIQTLCAIVTL